MNCPQSETTLLWIYGEAPDHHAEHVAECDVCTAVLTLHSEVATAIGPAPLGLDSRRSTSRRWSGLAAIAAATLLAIGIGQLIERHPTPLPTPSVTVRLPDSPLLMVDDLDERLDAMDDELNRFALDLGTL